MSVPVYPGNLLRCRQLPAEDFMRATSALAAIRLIGQDGAVDSDAPLSELFRAIALRDSERVSRLLHAYPRLVSASSQGSEGLLTEIPHQFYVGDSALHVAAAAFWPTLTSQLLQGGAEVA